jgi:rhodanese-related sulfurtransferase
MSPFKPAFCDWLEKYINIRLYYSFQEFATMHRFLLSFLWVLLSACSAAADADKVSLELARAEHEAGRVTLIDIREAAEHRTGIAQGALLLPMSTLPQRLDMLDKNPAKPVLLICNTQNRSKATLNELKKRGYQNIRYVDGGMSQWAAKGWPMSQP